MTALRIAPSAGPTVAPAAAAGAGLRNAQCLRYEFDGRATDAARSPFAAFWEDRALRPDDELVWAVFPAFDAEARDVRDGFRAAAVAIDLLFDDGRRLLAECVSETDRTSSAASARADLDFPDQWNERRLALGAFVGTRIVSAELVADPPKPADCTTELLEGWIDAARIAPVPVEPAGGASDRARTTRGSHSSPWRSRGNTQPLTGVPHGHLYVAPATDLSNPHWTYSWNAHGEGHLPKLAALLITRSPSIWIGDRGALAIRAGLVDDCDTGVAAEAFDHDNEIALPHRYRVTTLSGMHVHTAATSAGVVAEFLFPSAGRLVLCAPGAPLSHTESETTADGRLRLRVASTLPSPHEPDPMRGYYSLEISCGTFSAREQDGQVIIEVQPAGGPVRLEVGGSLLSTAQADQARLDVAGRSIDEVADAASAAWNEMLTIVDAPGASPEDRALIASDLYRLFLYPTRHHEQTPDGPRYASPTERRSADGPHATGRRELSGRPLTDNGFWDTYRAAWPAYNLLVPERAGHFLDGMLEHVRTDGWSPRWSAGTPLDAMVGTSLDVIAADAVASGIPGVDVDTAYAAALRNATAASADARFGRKGMPQTLALDYTPSSTDESVSWTIEGAINDAGAAVLARELAREATGAQAVRLQAEARYLAHRALSYRALWDSETRFFRPKNAEGAWADEPFDARVWGGAHTETNAWGSRFPAPHDGHALADLFGGEKAFGETLDSYFHEPETANIAFAGSYGAVIHEMPEARDIRRGMWAVSNQPAHHVPWMYAFTDRPWRTSEILHDAVRRLFRGSRIGQGFPGDEDNGEMSAWHLFAQLGFAPFQPGSGRLLITAPTLDHAIVRPIGAAPLEIITRRRHEHDRHIRAIRWNGAEWAAPTVGLRELHEGGTWEVELGPEPVRWSTPLGHSPFFAPDGVDAIRLTNIVTAVAVQTAEHEAPLPHTAEAALELGSGSTIELNLSPREPSKDRPLLVLGLAAAGTHAFGIEAFVDDGWHSVGQRSGETWQWSAQARPFDVDVPERATMLRIRWHGGSAGLTLAQVLAP